MCCTAARYLSIAFLAAAFGFALWTEGSSMAQDKKKKVVLPPDSLYALKVKTLEGTDADLGDYAGKVALVVNLASQ
jgi:hypothetical protein